MKKKNNKSREAEIRHKAMMLNTQSFLALQIVVQRQSSGITRQQLAKKAGVPLVEIIRLESGRWTDASLGVIKKLAPIFDVALKVHFERWSIVASGAP